ncbi:MAG TPA: GNAT family N-acetyltransferase [Gemmatimonadaceae bacterium]|nr:GNAT family N-acetyltransferase [Gemmatimonadaceae bacterium]
MGPPDDDDDDDGLRAECVAPEGAEEVHALLAACGRHMAEARGFRNWEVPYPLERLRRDAAERELYGVRREPGGGLLATYTLALEPAVPYAPGFWGDGPVARALYLNRLAVHPDAQGDGLGGWCMRRVEERARELGCEAVRFDVLAANAALRTFYERLGYSPRGMRTHGGWEFACYEGRP